MLTVPIARPLSTYTSFLSFFAFSILEKLYSLLLHVQKQQISCAFEILELLLLVLLLPEGVHYYCCYWCCWRELCVSYN